MCIRDREDIDRWQAKDLNDVMRRLPGVDIAQNGGMGPVSYTHLDVYKRQGRAYKTVGRVSEASPGRTKRI